MNWSVHNDPARDELQYDYLDTRRAMKDVLYRGTVRQVRVSNFNSRQFGRLLLKMNTKLVVYRMEPHPYLRKRRWEVFHE
jgi:diketogulonate reductase-like aldo/keto reductase